MGPVGRGVTASAGTAIMFVEVTYEYQPLLFGDWLGPRTIRSTAAYNIREARDLSGVKSPGTPATCDCRRARSGRSDDSDRAFIRGAPPAIARAAMTAPDRT